MFYCKSAEKSGKQIWKKGKTKNIKKKAGINLPLIFEYLFYASTFSTVLIASSKLSFGRAPIDI